MSSAKYLVLGLVLTAGVCGCEDSNKDSAIAAAKKANAAKSAEAKANADALAALIKKKQEERKNKPVEKDPGADIVCADGKVADFHDPVLEKEIRRKLDKPEGDIKISDLKKVRSVNLARGGKLTFLDPCIFPHLKGVRDLFLGKGKISDLSQLKHLNNLQSLRASHNPVSDLSPLSTLTKLDRIDLGRTQVEDLSPLSSLTNLEELMLDHTQVKDVSPLKPLEKLKLLTLSGSPVESPRSLARPGLKIVNE